MGYVNKTYLSTQFKNFADKIAKVFSKIGHTHLKSDITDFPTSMPANGGNAATVGGHTVGVNVPSNAKFTDTTYSKLSEFTDDVGYVKNTDARLTDARNAKDVYAWAKASKKPSYTKAEVGLGNVDNTADSAKTVYAAQRMIIQENRIDGNLESFEFNPEYSREHLGTVSFDIVGYDKENKVMTYGNSIDAIDTRYALTTFKSNDSTTGDSTPPPLLASGETHASIFSKVSTIFKNVRWLLSKMGTTDISSIGNGTVTGALSTLNSNMTGLRKTQLLNRTLSPLASGEISLDDNLSNYLYYEIIYSPDFQSNTRCSSGLIPVTSPTEVISVTPNAAGKGILIFTRSYTPNGNKMLAGVGYYYAALNSKGENYSGCNIVTRVYGYK